MRVKIKIRNTKKIYCKVKLKRKRNFTKSLKKIIKIIRIKLKKKTHHKLRLNDEIEKQNQSFMKGTRLKIIN
jgi:hypothetical protein